VSARRAINIRIGSLQANCQVWRHESPAAGHKAYVHRRGDDRRDCTQDHPSLARDLTFDYVGILPSHLQHVPVLAQRVPELKIVIDHLGKPPIATREFEPWSMLLACAARMPNVFAKVSGLEAGRSDRWTAADIAPYIDRALELSGPERLMFGSDWPVANLRGGYGKVWHETMRALEGLSPDEQHRVLGGTAIAFYNLPVAH
jgi:L-fuconolactonase